MKTILVAILVLMSFNAAASESLCRNISHVASGVMQFRQEGRDASDLIAVVSRIAENESDRIFYQNMILNAYEVPRFMSDNFKAMAITEFRDEAYVKCMRRVIK